jgi:hypothetical protein
MHQTFTIKKSQYAFYWVLFIIMEVEGGSKEKTWYAFNLITDLKLMIELTSK